MPELPFTVTTLCTKYDMHKCQNTKLKTVAKKHTFVRNIHDAILSIHRITSEDIPLLVPNLTTVADKLPRNFYCAGGLACLSVTHHRWRLRIGC